MKQILAWLRKILRGPERIRCQLAFLLAVTLAVPAAAQQQGSRFICAQTPTQLICATRPEASGKRLAIVGAAIVGGLAVWAIIRKAHKKPKPLTDWGFLFLR